MEKKAIQFDREVRLGEGGYGSVFPGTFQGRKVAVKRVLLIDAPSSDHDGKVLQQLNHPNIVKRLHFETDDNFKYFAMELCAASLDQLFMKPDHPQKYKGPKLPDHSTVFLQLAEGLEYIHSKYLIHRDIKPENVLMYVDPAGQITMKWADFGLSRPVNQRGTFTMNSGIKGTRNWYAPELLQLISQFQRSTPIRGTVKSDVFATGLVFAYLLLDGQHLYGSNEFEIHANIVDNKPVNISKIDPSHYALELISKMLKYEHIDRISSSDVVIQLKSIKQKLAVKEEELRHLCTNTSLNFETIKTLIQSGIDVNGKDRDGRNALHFLCCNNSSEKLIDAIKLLIQSGIDVNGEDKDGRNALHFLCRFNSSERLVDAIQLLIQSGIDVNGKNNDGWNALHFLCRFNSSEKLIDAIKLLIQSGIDVHEKDNDGCNALHSLCWGNSSKRFMDTIQLLIQFGIDVNGKDKDGRNALHFLCRYNSSEKLIDAIKFLIQSGIDVNEKDNDGRNALHFLCRYNSSEKLIDAIKLLIHFGIDVNGKDNSGRNTLHYLCANNSSEKLIDAVKLLIQLGTDVKSNGIDARFLLRGNFAFIYRKENIEEIIKLLNRAVLD